MTCASVTIRLRGLMYVNLTNQSVTYVSGTFVTLDSGLNRKVNPGEPMINLVITKQAQGADRPEPKGGRLAGFFSYGTTWTGAPPGNSRNLLHCVTDTEHGKPVPLPSCGKANRKER